MSKFAWVTLTTNDTYSLGALVLAHSLRRAGTVHQLAVLVTPGVSESMRQKLKDVYNLVQEVNVMDSQDAANLALLSRPELGITFTKLHCWRLVQFEKCVFLDSDTLILQNCDELFEREEFSAAPDVSWPDCFNSGVFVYKPSQDTFDKIVEFALKYGSFDGGDQGLLNQYFADWATSDITKRLPFLYNVTAYASYCYLPAFKQFRDKIKILHFAGKMKPWLIPYNSQAQTASVPTDYAHASDLIQMWWNIFFEHVHAQLNTTMLSLVKDCASKDNNPLIEQDNNDKTEERYTSPALMSWKCYYDNMKLEQQQIQQQQLRQDHIRYHNNQYYINHNDDMTNSPPGIQCNHFPYKEQIDILYGKDQVEFHDPWEGYYRREETESETEMKVEMQNNYQEAQHITAEVEEFQNINDREKEQNHISNIYTQEQNEEPYYDNKEESLKTDDLLPILSSTTIDSVDNHSCASYSTDIDSNSGYKTATSQRESVYPVETTEYPSTSRSISLDSTGSFDTDSVATLNDESFNDTIDIEEAGLAGALSQLRLGEQRSPEQDDYEQLMRRQCWESGQVDYLGRDSFENIWKKISETLEQKSTDGKTDMLTSADIEDGKVEFDKKTGVKVEYHKIDGGYQVKTTTPQPGGGWKSATQTFYDPKPVSEEDMKKQIANKKIIKTRLNKEIRIDSKTTMLTREIEGGYEEVYTTVNDDGTKSIKTKTFFDAIPEGQSFPNQAQKPAGQNPGSKKTITRKSSVESTDSTDSRKVVQKTNKNNSSTVEESRRVTQNLEYTENNRTVRKNSLQTEQTIKSVTSSNTTDGKDNSNKKKVTKKTKGQVPPPPADFVQNDTTTVATKRVPGGMEYTYSTQLESGKTITTSKTVYEEEECELTEEEIRAYRKTLKDAEKHKNVTSTKKLRSESGTKKIVPSENPGDVTTVETIKIEGGTEYHYTTVTAEGIVKKAVKTVYNPVPCSNPDDTEEEEIIEEYEEEIIEPGEKNIRTIETIKQLPQKFEEEVTFTSEKKEKKTKKTMTMVSH